MIPIHLFVLLMALSVLLAMSQPENSNLKSTFSTPTKNFKTDYQLASLAAQASRMTMILAIVFFVSTGILIAGIICIVCHDQQPKSKSSKQKQQLPAAKNPKSSSKPAKTEAVKSSSASAPKPVVSGKAANLATKSQQIKK